MKQEWDAQKKEKQLAETRTRRTDSDKCPRQSDRDLKTTGVRFETAQTLNQPNRFVSDPFTPFTSTTYF